MDFNYSEEQLKLKKEVHDFFVRELPSDYRARRLARRATWHQGGLGTAAASA